jgi:tetratricopeptide (TPR) repeat protein
MTLIFIPAFFGSTVCADAYLKVYATFNDGIDTAGISETFVEFGKTMPVFIPPYTMHFNIFPILDTSYAVTIDFLELGPGYSNHHHEMEVIQSRWSTIDNLPSKKLEFNYSFMITRDTADLFSPIPLDSLIEYETIHFKAHIWSGSYADYKWNSRSSLLESIFNRYRKELGITRTGKLDLYILPGSNTCAFINSRSGLGYDIAGQAFYAVQNPEFDALLPRNIQKFIIYEILGYSNRTLAAGFSYYFLDAHYRAKEPISNLKAAEIKAILSDENPENESLADILSGAFVKFIIDKYGLHDFKTLYKKSYPGYFAFQEVYKKSFDELLRLFLDYEKNLKLREADAAYFSDIYSSQLWFDKALPYRIWLAAQPIYKELHLKKLAAAYFQLGNYAQSESCYAALANAEPDNNEIRYLLNLAYLRSGKIEKAIAGLEKIAGGFPDASKMMAEIYLDREHFESARNALSPVKGVPDVWTAVLKTRLASASNESDVADSLINIGLALNNRVLSLVPGEARGYIDEAYLLMFSDSFDLAEQDLQSALFIDNRPYYRAMAALALGRLYDIRRDRKQALEIYGKVVEYNSGAYMKSLAEKYLKQPFKLK